MRLPARAACLTVLALVAGMAGLPSCFSTRSARPIAHDRLPASLIAILPVRPGDIRVTVDPAEATLAGEVAVAETPARSRDELASLLEDVLDDLAGSGNALIGPSRLRGRATAGTLDRLDVYLEDPDPIDTAWKAHGLAEIGRDIGTIRVVHVRVRLDFASDTLFDVTDPMAAHWKGRVTVTARLFSLDPPAVLADGIGEDRVWGKLGFAGAVGGPYAIVVPYALGRSAGKSLEAASREALTDLLSTMEPTG